MKLTGLASAVILMVGASLAFASPTINLTAMTTFGFNSDGWWAPGEGGVTYLTTDNNQRGMAYNRATDSLILVNRAGGLSVDVLNGQTGVRTGGLNTTGISGGTFSLNAVGVTDFGNIYAANLTTNSTNSPYKMYRWANEAAAPTVAYSGDGGLAGARLGDNLDVSRDETAGPSFSMVAGYNSTPSVAGNNGYAVFTGNGSLTAFRPIIGAPVTAGEHRLGLSYAGTTTVLGALNASTAVRVTDYSLGTPYVKTIKLSALNERMMDVMEVHGTMLLATVETINGTTASQGLVRIYDVSDLASLADGSALTALASLDLTAVDVTNGNASGAVAWGAVSGNTAALYTLNTNNGIQAFNVEVVPEPATATILVVGAVAAIRRRR